MSGYGGSPPPGWQDPYGGTPGWAGDPYGGNPYGDPGYGYGPPPPRSSNASTIAALVCNIISVVMCCGILSIPGCVISAIAMSRVDTDPESARKLTIWSWVLFGLSFVLGIILLAIYIAVVVMAESTSY